MKAWNKKKKPKYERKYSVIFYLIDDESVIEKTQFIIKNNKTHEIKILNRGTVLDKKDVIMWMQKN